MINKATDGGPKARRAGTSFSPDVEYLNKRIEEAEKKGLDFIGEWHRHPGNFDEPSVGDQNTIKEAMQDNGLDRFVALIVNLTGHDDEPELHGYLFLENGEVQKIDHRIIDEREVDKVMPWFMSKEGKKRLLAESKSMSKDFPNMTLHKKEDLIFWEGQYLTYRIRLVYPQGYPREPIDIVTIPFVNSVPSEPSCYHAVLAAQVARLRIDQEASGSPFAHAISQAPRPMQPESTPSSTRIEEQWYAQDAGRHLLMDLQSQLRNSFTQVRTLKLQDGRIAFSCFIDELCRDSVLLVLPRDFPETQPEVHAYVGRTEVAVEPLSPEKWRNDHSLISLIKYVISQLRGTDFYDIRHRP